MSAEEKEQLENVKKWYIVKTKTNCENKTRNTIENLVEIHKLQQNIGEILIPEKDVVEILRGKKTKRSKKLYPGYVFIEMDLTDRVWHLIRKVSSVISFVGGGKKSSLPPEVPKDQMEVIQDRAKVDLANPEVRVAFSVGETVAVIDGPFKGFSGVVREVNQEKGRITIEVSIFGGPTPVELDFDQVHSET